MIHIVLVNPHIPQNTGSIARTVAATKTRLHIIDPLFEISDRTVKRAGLDYWPYVDIHLYDDYQRFCMLNDFTECTPAWYFTKKASSCYTNIEYEKETFLFFGSESEGLPHEIIRPGRGLRIPIFEPRVRSLNLSNAVNIALYEALRQHGELN